MPSPTIRLVRGLYDDFGSGNIPGALARMSPDIVWNEANNFPYADGNPYIGPDAVLQGVFARIGADWDGFTVEIDEILDAGDTVVGLGRYRGKCKATGREQDTQIAHVFRVRDGKVVAFQQHADTLHIARVMGRA